MKRSGRDEDLLALAIRESVGGRLAAAASDAGSRAWSSSRSRRLVAAAATIWRSLGPAQKIRTCAFAAAVAMVVHLAMAQLGHHEPLVAVLPALVLVACAAIAVLAVPIARAWEPFGR